MSIWRPEDTPNKGVILGQGTGAPTMNPLAALFLLQLLQLMTQNRRGASSGSPAVLFGPVKAPVVSELQVSSQTDYLGNVRYTLTFQEPTDPNISHYNIYSKSLVNVNEQPTLVGSTKGSPAEMIISADRATNIAFVAQTVMRNGYTSPIEDSPTTGANIPTSVADIPGAPGTITTAMLADLAVTTAKLGNLAVTNGKLVDNAITETKISNNSISTPKLQANSVTANELAANSVTAVKIVAGVVSSDKLNTSEIRVGFPGALDRPAKFGVYNTTGTQIGFIGVEGVNQGAWFKTISIGGTSYATGQVKADASGNVTISGSINVTTPDGQVLISPSSAGLRVVGTSHTTQITGPNISIFNNAFTSQWVALQGSTSGGTLALYDSSGLTQRVLLSGASGNIQVRNSSGSNRVLIQDSGGAGDIELTDSAGSTEVDLTTTAGRGQLGLNDGGTEKIFLDANNGGAPEIRIDGASGLVLKNSTAAGANAGADTLPANPVGFLVVKIGGTDRKIPYYAT